jgi:methionyl aminopeptidase
MNKPGRNDPCYCGSGEKYKKCHMKIDQEKEKERRQLKAAGQVFAPRPDAFCS